MTDRPALENLDAIPQPAPWSHLEARAFNAVQPALREAGEWLPLSVRRAVARAVLAAVQEHLEIDDAEAWCKTCRRVWGGPRHQCETDTEQRLAQVEALAARIEAGHPVQDNPHNLAAAIRDAAADRPPADGHTYLSTGCRHGEHGYCQSHTGLSGAKKPSVCKFCGAHCICGCHKEAS